MLDANVTDTIDGGGGDEVNVPAGAGNVVTMICIKTGAAIFPLAGAGDCANVATSGGQSSHSQCILADGQYADGPCYMVSGIGTAKVTVSRKPATCPSGSGISHVDFLVDPAPPPPLGGSGVYPDVPGSGGSSARNVGVLAAIAVAILAGAAALGGATWYVRRRLR